MRVTRTASALPWRSRTQLLGARCQCRFAGTSARALGRANGARSGGRLAAKVHKRTHLTPRQRVVVAIAQLPTGSKSHQAAERRVVVIERTARWPPLNLAEWRPDRVRPIDGRAARRRPLPGDPLNSSRACNTAVPPTSPGHRISRATEPRRGSVSMGLEAGPALAQPPSRATSVGRWIRGLASH